MQYFLNNHKINIDFYKTNLRLITYITPISLDNFFFLYFSFFCFNFIFFFIILYNVDLYQQFIMLLIYYNSLKTFLEFLISIVIEILFKGFFLNNAIIKEIIKEYNKILFKKIEYYF